MRLFFLFAVICYLTGCSKGNSREPDVRKATISVVVKKNEKLSSGAIEEKDVPVSVIHIWKTNATSDIRIKSYSDAATGYAYNYTTSQPVKADYTFSGTSTINQEVEPGYYQIYIRLGDNIGNGSLAYSHVIFLVAKGDNYPLKKVFTTHVTTASYEEWGAVE